MDHLLSIYKIETIEYAQSASSADDDIQDGGDYLPRESEATKSCVKIILMRCTCKDLHDSLKRPITIRLSKFVIIGYMPLHEGVQEQELVEFVGGRWVPILGTRHHSGDKGEVGYWTTQQLRQSGSLNGKVYDLRPCPSPFDIVSP